MSADDDQAEILAAAVDKRRTHIGSRRSRILAFFATRPDEELTYADLVQKFDFPNRRAAQIVIDDMRRRQELESLHVIRLPAKGRAA